MSADWQASLDWVEQRSDRLTAREKGDFLLCHTATLAVRSGSRRGGFVAAGRALRSGRPGLTAWLVWGIHMTSPALVDRMSALRRWRRAGRGITWRGEPRKHQQSAS